MTRVRGTCSIEGCGRSHIAKGYCKLHYERAKAHGDPHYSFHNRTPSQRFWSFVAKSGDCWEWRGALSPFTGYGSFALAPGNLVMAHRFAYEDAAEQIPEGMLIDHMCHRRSCVRPSHLRVVTNKQNQENRLGASSTNRHGLRGVGYNKRTRKYRARVTHDGREYYGGEYETPTEAGEAARQLRLSLYTHNDMDRKAS